MGTGGEGGFGGQLEVVLGAGGVEGGGGRLELSFVRSSAIKVSERCNRTLPLPFPLCSELFPLFLPHELISIRAFSLKSDDISPIRAVFRSEVDRFFRFPIGEIPLVTTAGNQFNSGFGGVERTLGGWGDFGRGEVVLLGRG